jgi:signal peptidase I
MRNTRGLLLELAEVAALALGLYLVITFALQTVHVIGLSMYPTVDDQDYLIALKLPYRFHAPERGDIVIMRDPYDPSRDFIKRIVAGPGDRIVVREGKVFVNDRLMQEPYISQPWSDSWPPSGREQTLGADQFFVMGDNRNHSSDSRMFGPINRNQIEAQAWLRFLPLSNFGIIGGQPPKMTDQTLPTPA